MLTVQRAIAAALLFVPATAALAFSEDLCFTPTGYAVNCLPAVNNAVCRPGKYWDDAFCFSMVLGNSQRLQKLSGVTGQQRSVVHMDATFYLAEFVGFSEEQAYWIAAYDQAVDVGQYYPRSVLGLYYVDPDRCVADPGVQRCELITKDVSGFGRTNFSTGGIFYHFQAPFYGTSPGSLLNINGLQPDADSPETEPTLTHIKAWAEGKALLCSDGLTAVSSNGDYAMGASCYKRTSGQNAVISGQIAVFELNQTEPVGTMYSTKTGPQVISQANGTTVLSTGFDSYIGEAAPFARVGIYLHVYQDRISHHRCIDSSELLGPKPVSGAQPDFNNSNNNSECIQADHVLRHSWETGVDQKLLDPADQTLGAALNGTVAELVDLATVLGVPVSSVAARSPNVADSVFMAHLYAAMQISDANERIHSMAQAARRAGLAPMPGF